MVRDCYVIPACPMCFEHLTEKPTAADIAHLQDCADEAQRKAEACRSMAKHAALTIPAPIDPCDDCDGTGIRTSFYDGGRSEASVPCDTCDGTGSMEA